MSNKKQKDPRRWKGCIIWPNYGTTWLHKHLMNRYKKAWDSLYGDQEVHICWLGAEQKIKIQHIDPNPYRQRVTVGTFEKAVQVLEDRVGAMDKSK